MKIFSKLVVGAMLFSMAASAQIKNAKTEIFIVHGNCGMCKETIEKAITQKKVSEGKWDKETHKLTLTYDLSKTNTETLLKKIAYAGYDNEKYLAPQEAYNNLPGCCQYERPKAAINNSTTTDHTNHIKVVINDATKEEHLMTGVYESYLSIKAALVKSDGKAASVAAIQLIKELKVVSMEKMEDKTNVVWMDNLSKIQENAEHISETDDINHQRDHFASLSTGMHKILQAFKTPVTLYYQKCPMYFDGKGATWLSREKEIQNPYYGSKMLTCGSTIETINP